METKKGFLACNPPIGGCWRASLLDSPVLGHEDEGSFTWQTKNMSVYDFEALQIHGEPVRLEQFRGRPMLIVNTASACGFTPQFAGLEALHKQYEALGLVVLGFPCNQFGAQDKGSDTEIANFCQKNYGVSFGMMSKVEVNGSGAHPLFKWLTHEAPGILGTESIKWNFTKFLVGRDGQVIKRYASLDKPASLAADIEQALSQS
mgnify:CR=1 FL=1